MSLKRLDDLIEIARHAVNTEFDMQAIYQWKKQSLDFLAENLGHDHFYTQYFKNYMDELEQQNLLTGSGILTAAREEMRQKAESF
ncbi:MAG: hypothetical protein ACLQPD_08970 [Desulfomonilaceae bacterium]